MRLWSIHPAYLDAKGLVALWREALLAQHVLQGKTRGYRQHPQLARFKRAPNPLGAIACYLRHVADEADRRGYHFDRSKILNKRYTGRLAVTRGQAEYEIQHLLRKLKTRDPVAYRHLRAQTRIRVHPLFKKTSGAIEAWEVV
jgi:hypothetical protein